MGLSLSYEDKIAVLDLGDDENRFSPEFLDAVDAHLDELIGSSCRGKSLYTDNPKLVADISSKAKMLKAAIGKFLDSKAPVKD